MYLLESPRRGDSNKYTKHMIYKRKCSKVSVTDALDGSYQVSLKQQIRFYCKIFGNNHCRSVAESSVHSEAEASANPFVSLFSYKTVDI